MIERLVHGALKAPALVVAGLVVLLGAGALAYANLDIEAYPNPVPPLIEVITQVDGLSAEEVERYVTVPLEVALSGMPGLTHRRSQSIFGLSDIKCYFAFGTDYSAAKQEVTNRLQFAEIGQNVTPQLSPWNATGEVFRYTLEGEGYTLGELKAAQDFILERQFRQVPGVIDVTSYGGQTKQYHVEVDPFRLRAQHVTLDDLERAITNANLNVGGQRLTIGEQSYDIRGVGVLRSIRDIADVVIKEVSGTPIRVRDVAEVHVGAAPRLGMVGQDDRQDLVQGTVLMRYGEQTPKTLAGVHERLAYIRANRVLPPGMEIRPYYDRGELVALTTHTVLENAAVGIALVVAVLWLFLGSVPAALVTAINIPLALLLAFIGLVATGTSANLISLGAVDFGIVVDSTVIMIENVFHHLGPGKRGDMAQRIVAAAAEVGRPMAFSTAIIAVTFLPLFTMTGVAGIIFAPMARTYAMAILGAIVLALTATPVLLRYAVRPDYEERENWLMRGLHRVYNPLFAVALRHPKKAAALHLVPVLMVLSLLPFLGGEFMPKLEEGNLWIRATLPTSVSFEQSARYVGKLRDAVRGCPDEGPCDVAARRYPEVKLVQSQMGRPDDGTDVTGFYNVEMFAPLVEQKDFRPGMTKEALVAEMSADLEAKFPGILFNFSQMISDNVEEAVAGVKGENSIKVFGADIVQNEALAEKIVATLREVPGIEDLGLLRSLGQPSIRITPDRRACARYGLNTGDIDAIVQGAVGGQAVTQVFEGEKRFDLTIRWLPAYRDSLSAIRRITVPTPEGKQVPLAQLATVETIDGPATVYREDGERYAPVKFSVRGRDLAGAVGEAQRAIATHVPLPYDAHLAWAGEMNELRDVQARLAVVVPLSLLVVAFLVYLATKRMVDTLIVLVDIPVACSGGILALLATGQHFSVSAAMGFVSIFGIAVQDAILVVTYFQRLFADGLGLAEAAHEAAEKRFRPVLMTTLVATLGLLPAAMSHAIGAQTQKPLAIVVIGGSLMVALLTRILTPTLLVLAYQGKTPGTPAGGKLAEPSGGKSATAVALVLALFAVPSACKPSARVPAPTSTQASEAAAADTNAPASQNQGEVVQTAHGAAAEAKAPPAEPRFVLTAQQANVVGLQTLKVGVGEAQAPIVVSGRLTFDEMQVARVVPPVNGHVTRVLVQQGEHVQKGQALATISSPDLGQVVADLESSHADLLAAERDLARNQALYNDQAVAAKTVEAALRRRSEAAADYARARDKSALLGGHPGADSDAYVVRAPIDGNVIVRTVTVGSDVQGQYENGATAPELFTLGSLDSLWAMGEVYAMDLPAIHVGDRVQVQVAAYPDEWFETKVDWVAPGVDPESRATRLRCRLDNQQHRLKPEMFVTMRIFAAGQRGTVVPASAIFYLGGAHYVFVRVANEGHGTDLAFVRRKVQLGQDIGGLQALVVDGLDEGAEIVSRGGILLMQAD